MCGINNVNGIVNELLVELVLLLLLCVNDLYFEGCVKLELIVMKGILVNYYKVVSECGNFYLMGFVMVDEGNCGVEVVS